MNVSVENLGPCKKLLRVEVASEQVDAAFDEMIGKYQRLAQLPGFRAGKAPKHLVVKNFDSQIKEETRRTLFEKSYRDATAEQKLRVIATIGVEEQSFGRGQPFGYTATLEHAPEFELPVYKGLTAQRVTAVVTDADVERALNILREQHVKYNDVSRPSQTGDIVVVNYTGTSEGKPLTEFNPTAKGLAEKKGMWMLIQEGSFIPGFTEQLIGVQSGDLRTVKITFPPDFVISELVGKEGEFAVEITGVKEKVLPEVGEDFAKEFNASSLEELTQGIRRDLQNEQDFRTKRAVRDQLLKQLLSQVQFDLPESVVSSETRQLVYNIVNENQQRGIAPDVIEANKQEIFQKAQISAQDRVKAAFVLNRIAEAEKIGVSEKEVTQRVLLLAQQNNQSPDKMVKILQERNAFPEIQQDILTGKVLDWLELNSRIEDAPASTQPATT
ncbi:MAG TPA: trigger factor [Verrucomicrobiota bacterium]|nr:trigger factor [Verrucomicrobiales bacterium]HRI16668.1 trigger factor [Verrucomicrobiota bacterium]